MLCPETEVKINLGLLHIKRDGAGAAVVVGESYDIACRQPKTFRVFVSLKKKKEKEKMPARIWNTKRNGLKKIFERGVRA